jgi:hypothetical protein
MKERDSLPALQHGLNLAKPDRNEPGLGGHAERIEGGALEKLFGAADKVSGRANVLLEAARKRLAFDRLIKRVLCRGDPDPAPGKLPLEIRHRLAAGPDDEPDQVRDRANRARGDAQAFESTRARSGIELNVVR